LLKCSGKLSAYTQVLFCGSVSVGEMFSTSTQRKYWTFHEHAELEQLREEVNHQYVAKNGGGDMDADVCVTTYVL